jgi:hypothetical protein
MNWIPLFYCKNVWKNTDIELSLQSKTQHFGLWSYLITDRKEQRITWLCSKSFHKPNVPCKSWFEYSFPVQGNKKSLSTLHINYKNNEIFLHRHGVVLSFNIFKKIFYCHLETIYSWQRESFMSKSNKPVVGCFTIFLKMFFFSFTAC